MKLKILFLLLLSALWFYSCNSDDDSIDLREQIGEQIKFKIAFAEQGRLRTATDKDFKTEWKTGDEIGLFAVKHGENLAASDNSLHNMKVTFDGTNWNGAYWPNDENKNENLDFYAYYPYDAAITDPTTHTFSVNTDQRGMEYNKSDLLLAKASNQSKGSTLNLQFSHALSLVRVEVKREVNMPHFDADFNVTLTGVLPNASLSWLGNLTGTGTATDIMMHKVEGLNNTFRALVPAQTLAADSKVTFVQTTAEKEIDMEYHGVKNTALTAKNAHKYSVTLGYGIDPNHVYAVGDVYPHIGPAIGIVFYIESGSDGKHGKIVSLDEQTKIRWADAIYSLGAMNESNGRINMQIVADYINANNKDWDNFPVFEWIHGKNAAGTDYSNANITGVWYLPAISELQYFYCAINAKTPETWYDLGGPSWGIGQNAIAIETFNQKLISNGGEKLGYLSQPFPYYMSSSANISIFNRFDSIVFTDGQRGAAQIDYNDGLIARAIMAF